VATNRRAAFKKITPTVCLREENGRLLQRVRVWVENPSAGLEILAATGNETPSFQVQRSASGETWQDIYLEECKEPTEIEFALKHGGSVLDSHRMMWNPPKHWTVHLIHSSHHDIGYTDLPSNVLSLQSRNLQEALRMASYTDAYPEEAQFRIVIEQYWSIHYLLRSLPDLEDQLLSRIRSGHLEITALFGNMITEICGHESLIRALYPAFAMKRKYGISITTAEHNDIPGFSWGLSQLLADAGIRLFCPSIPRYYDWADFEMPSFWNDEIMQPRGLPQAFWWEAPSGDRILFWSRGIQSVGGTVKPEFSALTKELSRLEGSGYPYSLMRWKIFGGQNDNSPYLLSYSDAIRDWNAAWRYPRLVFSTNERFYRDLIKEIPEELPVFRGALPGQDYPAGATSTALPTAANRRNHTKFTAAEHLAEWAHLLGADYPEESIARAGEDILRYDEHTWGYHLPCGPAVSASEHEKAVHAFRAAALTQDIVDKATAYLADHISTKHLALVVFNPGSFAKTAPVTVPMRAIDCCGITMGEVTPEEDRDGIGFLKGMLLGRRWHENPPQKMLCRSFDLIDTGTSEPVPYQLLERTDRDPIPYAAQRFGVGSGRGTYGTEEPPGGLLWDLCLVAEEVPAFGYRTYQLVPRDPPEERRSPERAPQPSDTIENEFYKISVDAVSRRIDSIIDKESKRELLDPECPHPFASVVVRSPREAKEFRWEVLSIEKRETGPVCSTLEIAGRMHGHPQIRETIVLFAGVKEIFLALRILKDATPLLETHVAFPIKAENPQFRYEGTLSCLAPIDDYLPGAYSDTIPVQNWVQVQDDAFSVLWASLDAPVARFSSLWPSNVSPAHRCIISREDVHPPKGGFTRVFLTTTSAPISPTPRFVMWFFSTCYLPPPAG
jgi:hypothetical protein